MSGTNRETIVVQRAASQVQGDTDLLGKVFQLRKLREVVGMVISDIQKWFHWFSVDVIPYNCVSKQEWVYVPRG